MKSTTTNEGTRVERRAEHGGSHGARAIEDPFRRVTTRPAGREPSRQGRQRLRSRGRPRRSRRRKRRRVTKRWERRPRHAASRRRTSAENLDQTVDRGRPTGAPPPGGTYHLNALFSTLTHCDLSSRSFPSFLPSFVPPSCFPSRSPFWITIHVQLRMRVCVRPCPPFAPAPFRSRPRSHARLTPDHEDHRPTEQSSFPFHLCATPTRTRLRKLTLHLPHACSLFSSLSCPSPSLQPSPLSISRSFSLFSDPILSVTPLWRGCRWRIHGGNWRWTSLP